MEKCSRCGEPLNEFKIRVKFNIKVDRLKDNSIWEYIPNLHNESNEILCNTCFMKFSELISEYKIN